VGSGHSIQTTFTGPVLFRLAGGYAELPDEFVVHASSTGFKIPQTFLLPWTLLPR
jgi:hypothetical protein